MNTYTPSSKKKEKRKKIHLDLCAGVLKKTLYYHFFLSSLVLLIFSAFLSLLSRETPLK